MDSISYSKASQQEQRIKKVIANPDSTSGVVTVPTTIATGETITIPAGRMAILPNLQIDGKLVVDGEVFIPNGTSLSKVVEKVPSTDNAIVRFDGTGGVVQDSKVVVTDSGYIRTNSSASGEHVFKPNTTSEHVRVSAAASDYSSLPSWSCTAISQYGSTATGNFLGSIPNAGLGVLWGQNINNLIIGNNANAPIIFANSAIEKMRIDVSGNVLVTGSGGLGYGTGSGGTVTQLTSKSTPVTLNKPTGKITMNNASLAAGAYATFTLYSTSISIHDNINIQLKSGLYNTGYRVGICAMSDGACSVYIKNDTAGALAEPVMLTYSVIKGATA